MKVGTSKEKIEMGIKNQLKTILHMLTFNIVTIIMLIFGNCWSTSIETLGGIIVEANMFVFLCCMIILLFVIYNILEKAFKKGFKEGYRDTSDLCNSIYHFVYSFSTSAMFHISLVL